MYRCLFLTLFFGVFHFQNAEGRLLDSTYSDLKTMLESGNESAAELTGYYFLRNYRDSKKYIDVKFHLAEIYFRQSRTDEMILWLKALELEPGLSADQQSKLAYLMLKAQEAKGDAAAVQIQRALILRKFPKSEWAKKVSLK